MIGADVVAAGAVSALGIGADACRLGAVGERPPCAVAPLAWLREAGLRRPVGAAALSARDLRGGSRVGDPVQILLDEAFGQLTRTLDGGWGGWRSLRVGLALGTSGGALPELTRLFELRDLGAALSPELACSSPYFGPVLALRSRCDLSLCPVVQVLAACASSTLAMGLACRWLEHGHADIVIAGGYDALSTFIAAGFEALAATTGTQPRPFCLERDGLAVGEGAALVALARPGEHPILPLGRIAGFGASADAVHVTAPDRTGQGLAAAARLALSDAAAPPQSIDLVSAHGTATNYNDAAEVHALVSILGDERRAAVLHPFKAAAGHTMGAAGALESLAALEAMRRSLLPASACVENVEPLLPVRLLSRNASGASRCCLKLSSGFGGANAALVLTQGAAGPPRTARSVHVLAVGEPCEAPDPELVLGAVPGADRSYLLRVDSTSGLILAAVGSAVSRNVIALSTDRTGVVLGTAAATLEANERFDARRRQRGAASAEPRRFPPTSPNLAVGQCGIVFGFKGPSLAVGASPAAALEALLVGYDLIASADADAVVVVAADEVGIVVRDVWHAAGWPLPRQGACAAILGAEARGPALDRAELTRVHQAAQSRSGLLGAAAPGWPLLGEGLRAGGYRAEGGA
ncbi:MAG: 3-oxoacyl-ACP synthase [Polyangiaceae bacterium]|nr:3-oxoacyl-ACP synthase [Polyangiaceae bacterium]